ncbi:MAG TPA: phosphotransferase family protein [Tepidiformaceae bacterium]|nr:phosphotransferase family protein [Tepidiformaceae bacterium]
MDIAEVQPGLTDFVSEKAGHAATIENLVRLSGGASRETWTFDAHFPNGSESIEGIFRCDPIKGVVSMPGRVLEYHLIKAAWEAGVVVPEPLWDGDDRFGVKFFTMRRVPGEALGARMIRGEQYGRAREVMSQQLAQSLARIHTITRDAAPALAGLPGPKPGVSVALAEVENYEASFRLASPNPHPVFELALRWIHANLPQVDEQVLVHGDYRLGNFLFGEEGLRGVIDWELAHWGDPMEDIGWLAVKSWRFGGKRPMAGIGEREAFYREYEAAGGHKVDRERVKFWELFGNLRWGVITIGQAANYLNGRSKSVELASIGRRTAETEWELLNLLEGKGD